MGILCCLFQGPEHWVLAWHRKKVVSKWLTESSEVLALSLSPISCADKSLLCGSQYFYLYSERLGPDNLWELFSSMFVKWSCIFMEIVTSCHANFKVSALSLLEFTAFIMACHVSVHQLKRSEPYLTWLGPKLQKWYIPHSSFHGIRRSEDFPW